MPEHSPERPRQVTFELVDRPARLAGVRLIQEIGLGEELEFVRTRGVWQLTVDLPDVQRMEYLFEIRDRHGHRTTVTDPANPRRAPGAFGEKSVLELPGYEPPAWLTTPTVDSDEPTMSIEAPELDAPVELALWSPADLDSDRPAPLLIVHDGPEFAKLGGFTQYLGAAVAAGDLPPLRAALVSPGERDVWYAANPGYASALTERVLPALDDVAPVTVRVGIGVSLGAVAMLHVHHGRPGVLDGLFLQSGSFFTPDLDPQESRFSGFEQVTRFVASVHGSDADAIPLPTVVTCGAVEENLANNRLMAATLSRLGYPVRTVIVPDAHNYVAWRDALHPNLAALVGDVAGARAS